MFGGFLFLTDFAVGLEKILQNTVISHLGREGFLAYALILSIISIYFLKNRLNAKKDENAALRERLNTKEERAKFQEEQLVVAAAQLEERSKIVEERNRLSKERLVAGEALRKLMALEGSIQRFPKLQPHPARYKRTILLVEDEKAIHTFKHGIEDAFSDTEVRLASNGAEGLVEIKKRRPCLVITDLVMPVLSGFQFIETLAREYPDIPVVATSAYVDGPIQVAQATGFLPKRFVFLAKPYLLTDLIDAIQDIIPDVQEDAGQCIAL